MAATRQHYNLAVSGKATQKCDKPVAPKPEKGAGGSPPMRKGKR